MRRKLVMNGPSSLTVSLPSTWTKRNALKKGDEIDIIETEDGLLIKPTNKSADLKSYEVSFAGLDDESKKKVILCLHNNGYDEITINFEQEKTLKDVYSFLTTMQLGFEIISHTQKRIVVKNISNPEPEQFDNLLRRMFLIELEYAKKIYAIIKSTDNLTDSCPMHELSIKRIGNYCKRICITESRQDSIFKYLIIKNLENIAYNLSEFLNNTMELDKVPSSLIEAYESTIEQISRSYELYYKFSLNAYDLARKSLKQTSTAMKKSAQKQTQVYINNLLLLHKEVAKLDDSILSMNLESK